MPVNDPSEAASWNPDLYQSRHSFVFHLGEGVVELLDPKEGEKILDLGCGTGDLTAKILQSGAVVTGMDQSAGMITRGKNQYPFLNLVVGDALELPYRNEFDAVFSNATLHWILQLQKALDGIFRALKPGGRLVGEMGGKDNISRITGAIAEVLWAHGKTMKDPLGIWNFPSPGEFSRMLESSGFRLNFLMYFDRDTRLEDPQNGIVDWLDMFGAYFFRDIPSRQQLPLKLEIQESLKQTNYCDGAWWADYKRIRFVASKPIS
ncbi:MAG TPA: class I SAM-dependent methyltransferase [Chitinophagaceae bacterium]|nr:class I SAM-dependent methyltransferase [Chitinophagaceae bacterium]